MKNKKTTLLYITFLILLFPISQITFISFQAFLTMISKEGDMLINFIGPSLIFVLLTLSTIYCYEIIFKKESLNKCSYRKKGFVLSVISLPIIIFMTLNTISFYKNNLPTPSIYYPIGFLIIGFLGLFFGITLIAISFKKESNNEYKEKTNILSNIFKIIYVFIALDRLGCLIVSLVTSSFEYFDILILPYIQCLTPSICIASYLLYKNNFKEKRFYVLTSIITLLLGVVSTGYIVLMLFSKYSSDFIRILSLFFGFDRLIGKAYVLIIISAFSILPQFISIILLILKNNKRKL